MRKIHIARGSQQLGQFGAAEVAAGLKSGRFSPSDLAWEEGMPEWKPLASITGLESFFEDEPAAETPDEMQSASPARPATAEPAWERRGDLGFVGALVETVRQVLTQPAPVFSAMPKEAGFGNPLLYSVLLSWVGFVASCIYQYVYMRVDPASFEESFQGVTDTIFLSALVATVMFMPLVLIAAAFIGAAIMHFFLWMLGGARYSYQTTFRVLCYSQGSTAVLQFIPICGGLFYSVWYLYCSVVGLAKAHDTDVWRVVVAVLLPAVLFCGGMIALVTVLAGYAIMQAPGS